MYITAVIVVNVGVDARPVPGAGNDVCACVSACVLVAVIVVVVVVVCVLLSFRYWS